jgi:hypothetical protein
VTSGIWASARAGPTARAGRRAAPTARAGWLPGRAVRSSVAAAASCGLLARVGCRAVRSAAPSARPGRARGRAGAHRPRRRASCRLLARARCRPCGPLVRGGCRVVRSARPGRLPGCAVRSSGPAAGLRRLLAWGALAAGRVLTVRVGADGEPSALPDRAVCSPGPAAGRAVRCAVCSPRGALAAGGCSPSASARVALGLQPHRSWGNLPFLVIDEPLTRLYRPI